MKIIAATDFSPAANNAVRSALQLARKLGDSVLLVRVIEPAVAVYPELRLPESTVFDAAVREANEAEMAKAVSALEKEGVPVEGRTLIGSPARVLAEQAAGEKARLIVVGMRGRGAIARVVLGSVAERTVLEAPCPVLVVPESATPFAAWLGETRPLRALVGLDLDSATAAVLEAIQQLRKAAPCDVTLVHTYWPPAEYTRLGLRGPRTFFETDPEVVAVLEREIRARIELEDGAGTTTLRIESAWGRVGDTLALDAQVDKADLVVVGTRQPHGWDRITGGSSAIGALRAARTAVLCVPAKAPSAAAPKRPSIPVLKTILAATDLSELGNRAVVHAYSLLRGSGGVVELCHVHARHIPHPAVYDPATNAMSPGERAALEAQLRALIPADADSFGITTHVTVIDGGAPAEAIAQAAQRLGADAITLGSHGRSGLSRAVLGSVAEAVLRGSDKPVFVVRAR